MDTDRIKELIVKYLIDDLTDAEARELHAWQTASEANEALLLEISSEKFLRQAVMDDNKVLRETEVRRLKKATVGKGQKRLTWLHIAATIAVFIGLSIWFIHDRENIPETVAEVGESHVVSSEISIEFADGRKFTLGNDTVLKVTSHGPVLVNQKDTICFLKKRYTPVVEHEFYTIRIPRGKEYITRLEDGSIVHLNSDSELKVPVSFGEADRKVFLKGEAFLEVVTDVGKRKFIVSTSKADITVLGTQFNVKAYEEDGEVMTTLVKGAVNVNSGGNISRQLRPGEQARVSEKGNIDVQPVDVYRYIAWREGRFVYENECLEHIMTELQRWYDYEIQYTDPEVKKIRFTIDIARRDKIEKVLALMEKTGKVSFVRTGKTILIQ